MFRNQVKQAFYEKSSYFRRPWICVELLLVALVCLSNSASGIDWPHWNGPSSDGGYREDGVIQEIPTGGLKKRWSAEVGIGYSGPAVANGLVYLSDYVSRSGQRTNNPGTRDRLEGTERIHAFDVKTGKELWSYQYEREYAISYPGGPRATPTVDGNLVYALGAEGDLVCLEADRGKLIWKRQLRDDYKTESPIWGYSAAPFIYENLVIVLAGGEGSLLVALDKQSGNEVWRSISGANIGYCPPRLLKIAGEDQLLVWEPKALHGLVPKTGKVIWSIPFAPKYDMSITPPIVQGDRLFVSGIGEVAAMFAIDRQSTSSPLRELWRGKAKHAIYCANSTPVFDGDYLYGADCEKGSLICVRASDGERMWETFQATCGGDRRMSHGTAFLSKVGDLYYLISETGDFIIAKLSPEAYQEIGRFKVLEATNECFGRQVVWSYPAYSDHCLFARNDKELVAYEVGK